MRRLRTPRSAASQPTARKNLRRFSSAAILTTGILSQVPQVAQAATIVFNASGAGATSFTTDNAAWVNTGTTTGIAPGNANTLGLGAGINPGATATSNVTANLSTALSSNITLGHITKSGNRNWNITGTTNTITLDNSGGNQSANLFGNNLASVITSTATGTGNILNIAPNIIMGANNVGGLVVGTFNGGVATAGAIGITGSITSADATARTLYLVSGNNTTSGITVGVVNHTGSIITGDRGDGTLQNGTSTITTGAIGSNVTTITTNSSGVVSFASLANTGNVTFNNNGTLTANVVGVTNTIGSITSQGASTGTVSLIGGIGTQVTSINLASTAGGALNVGTTITVNGSTGATFAGPDGGAAVSGLTFTNASTIAGTNKVLTISGSSTGTGNLYLQNNANVASGINITGGVNHTGYLVSNGTGTTAIVVQNSVSTLINTSGTTVGGIIGTNVKGVIINSPGQQNGLTGVNTFANDGVNTFGLIIRAGGATLGTSNQAGGLGAITLGDSTSSNANQAALIINTITPTNQLNVVGNGSQPLILGSVTGAGNYAGAISLSHALRLVTLTSGANLTVSGGINGTGDLIIGHGQGGGGAITISGSPVNMTGDIIDNFYATTGATNITAAIGTNVGNITQNAMTVAPLNISGGITISGNRTYSQTSNVAAPFTINSILGSGNVTFAGSASAGNITGTLVNHTGNVTNNNNGTGTVLITIGTNVGVVTQNGSSPFNVGGAITLTGSNNTITSTGSGLFTLTGGLTGTAQNLVFNANSTGNITESLTVNTGGTIINNGTGTNTVTITGAIGNSVSTVTQNSPNSILALGAANLFTGSLTVQRGTVNLANAGGASSSAVTLGGGGDATLLYSGNSTVANTINLVNVAGTLSIGAAGSGGGSFGGPINLNGKDLFVTNNSSGALTLTSAAVITNSANTITFVGNSTGVTSVGSLLGSNLNLVVNSSGQVTLNNTGNLFTGVNVVSGRLTASYNAVANTILGSGTVTLGSAANTAVTLTVSGSGNVTNPITLGGSTATTTIANTNGSTPVSLNNTINGTGNLLIGAGASVGAPITVAGAVNFNGTLTVGAATGYNTAGSLIAVGFSQVTLTGGIGSNVTGLTVNSANNLSTTGLFLGGASAYTINGPAAVTAGYLHLNSTASLTANSLSAATGTTLDLAGAVTLGTNGTGNLNVVGGATLSTLGNAPLTFNITNASSDGVTLGSAASAAIWNFDVGATADQLNVVGANGTASILAGGLTLNPTAVGALSGTTQVLINAPGGLTVANAGNVVLNTATGNFGGYTLDKNITSTQLQLTEVRIASDSTLLNLYFNGDVGTSWANFTGGNANNSNFNTDATSGVDAQATPDATTTVHYSTNTASNLTTVGLGRDYTIKALAFDAVTATTTIATGNTLTITPINGVGGITATGNTGDITFNPNITLGGTQTWTFSSAANKFGNGGTINGTGNLTVQNNGAGNVLIGNNVAASITNNVGTFTSAGNGAGPVYVAGIGSNVTSVIQSAANASSTLFILSAGSIKVGTSGLSLVSTSAASLNSASPVTSLGSGSTFTIYANSTGAINQTGVINSVGTVTNAGTGTGAVQLGTTGGTVFIGSNVTSVTQSAPNSVLTIVGANTFGNLFINEGTVTTGEAVGGTNTSFGAGSIFLGANSSSASALLSSSATGKIYANPIVLGNTSGTLTIEGRGSNGLESFTGGITGPNSIILSSPAASGSGGLAVTGGAINNSGAVNFTGTNKINVTAAISTNVTGVNFNNSGAITNISGGITANGNITIATIGTGLVNISGTIINNAGTITNNGSSTSGTTISAPIGSAVTGITQNSTATTLTLSGALTTATGGTTLTAAGGNKAMVFTGAASISGGGALTLRNNTTTNDVINIGGPISITNAILNSGTGTGRAIISGNIAAGVTSVTQNGTSALALTGTNAYTGPTTVTAGSLILGGGGDINASSGVSVNGATARFVYNSSVAGTTPVNVTLGTLDGTTTMGPATIANSASNIITAGDGGAGILGFSTLTFNGAATTNLSLSTGLVTSLNVVGALTTSGTANIVINVANTGATAAGDYTLIDYGSFGGSGYGAFTLGTVGGVAGQRTVATLVNDTVNTLIQLHVTGGQPFWSGGGTNWNTTDNAFGLNNGAANTTPFISGDIVTFDDTAAAGVNYTAVINAANVDPTSVIVNNSTITNYTISSTGGFGIADYNGSPTTLTKTGSKTLTITSNNTYTGLTSVSGTGSTIVVGSNNALGSAVAGTTIAAGSGVQFQGDVTVPEPFTLNFITSGSNDQALTNLSGTNNLTGQITLNGGSDNIRINAAGGIMNISGNIVTNGTFSTGVGLVVRGADATQVIISGVISGNPRLTIQTGGTGTLRLSGANTFTGDVSMTGSGTVIIDSYNSTGVNRVATGSFGAPTTATAGTILLQGGATVRYVGTGETTDRIINLNGTAALTQEGTGALVFTSNMTGGTAKTLTLGGSTAGTGEISGTIPTATTVNKTGTGLWTLSGANVHTAATNVNAGALAIANSSALGTTAAGTTVASGAALRIAPTSGSLAVGAETLSLNGTGLTANPQGALRVMSGSANTWAGAVTIATSSTIQSEASTALTLNGGVTLTGASALTVQGDGNLTVATTGITGGGSLAKAGNGTMALSATSNFTGATTVTGGTLRATVSGSLNNTSSVSVNSGTLILGATTGGSNALNDSAGLNLGTGSQLQSAGGSEGVGQIGVNGSFSGTNTAGIGTLTLSANSTLDFNADGNVSTYYFSGFNYATFTLAVVNWNNTLFHEGNVTTGNASTDRLIFSGLSDQSAVDALLSHISFNGSTELAAIQLGSGTGVYEIGIAAIPEPSTVYSLLLVAGLAGYRERRRLRRIFSKNA